MDILKNLRWTRQAVKARLDHSDIDSVLEECIESIEKQDAEIAALRAQLAEARKRQRANIATWRRRLDALPPHSPSEGDVGYATALCQILKEAEAALAAAQEGSDE